MSTSRKKPVPAKKPATPRPAGPQTVGLEEIKALIALVGREPFQEFEFEAGDMRFRIRKDGPAPVVPLPTPVLMGAPAVHHLPVPSMPSMPVAPAAPEVPADEPGIHYVTSPIVGTFYRAPNPTSAPYAQPGDFVKPGQTLCIIEAMKLMNEIESDVAGEVVKVLVENGQPVEYGERLFAVRIG
ncbi:MAG TPA: acetyl-CoA carboxylase biotin carboxyl carrier protein [Holophagaceae bacterium]